MFRQRDIMGCSLKNNSRSRKEKIADLRKKKKSVKEERKIWCRHIMIKLILLFNLMIKKKKIMVGNNFLFPC